MTTELLDEQSIQALRARVRGEVVTPGDAGYDAARRVWNAMIDRRPALVVRPTCVEDVLACIRFAHEHPLPVAVRGGGHSAAGLGTCDAGLVIDLGRMNDVKVDSFGRTVRVQGGATWHDVDAATHPHGLAVPGGIVSTTGVGGLTLGGGIGYLTRKHGLSIDSLLEAEVVLADARCVVASASENQDLFWALRGGGGNFGVVTSFMFRAHRVRTVCAGPVFYAHEQAAEVLRFFRDTLAGAPEDLTAFFAFLRAPDGPPFPDLLRSQPLCAIIWCYTGPADRAQDVLEPLRKFGRPALDLVRPVPFPALQAMFDPVAGPGLQQYWRGDFFDSLSEAAIRLHVKYSARMPTSLSAVHIYPTNGAAQRVDSAATAYAWRDASWLQVIIGSDSDPARNADIVTWTKDYWLALHPHSAGGTYVNFLMDEGQDCVAATYKSNYARLSAIKARLDPGNFFQINHNVRPA